MSATNEQIMQERIDDLEEALRRIEQWGEAYPLDIFPEPDWQRARNLLENGGMTLDRVAAGSMRRVASGVAKIARNALGADGQSSDG